MTQQIKRIGLRVPYSLYEKILGKADTRGKTINSFCLDVFWQYFEKVEKDKKSLDGGEP